MIEPEHLHRPYQVKFAWPVVRVFLHVLFWVLGPVVTKGRYRVPRKGGVIILANHLADVDPVVTQMACPRDIYFMAKSELFDMKIVGSVLRYWNAFPVKRGEPDRNALKHAAELAKAGHVVCVYPEGQLSETGELQPLKAGIALIVRMAGVPVICLGLRNTNRVLPYGSLIPRPAFRAVRAEWGEPREFSHGASTEEILAWTEAQLRALTGQT